MEVHPEKRVSEEPNHSNQSAAAYTWEVEPGTKVRPGLNTVADYQKMRHW